MEDGEYLVVSIVEQLTTPGEASEIGPTFGEEFGASPNPWDMLGDERFGGELCVDEVHNKEGKRHNEG